MQCEFKSKMPGCAGSTSLKRPFFAALEAFCRAYCTLVGSHRSVRSVGPSWTPSSLGGHRAGDAGHTHAKASGDVPQTMAEFCLVRACGLWYMARRNVLREQGVVRKIASALAGKQVPKKAEPWTHAKQRRDQGV